MENVPEEVWENLEYEIARAELEYSDNLRAYRCFDLLYFEDFMKAEKGGCCGVFETSTTCNDGNVWIIACNYGH